VAERQDKPARSRDSVANTLIVALSLSLVASVLVATAAIFLKPVQERNEARYKQQIILDVAGLYSPGADIDTLFQSIETRLVDLDSGEYTDAADAGTFDEIAAAKDAELGTAISPESDIAKIRQRARYAPVYLVREDDEINQVILPVYGAGLWSTIRGFLAVSTDGNTVQGLRFYEHAETPGLGDGIDKPAWRSQWPGKRLYDEDDELRIEVVRGLADPNSALAMHQVDGLAGATLTGRGVMNLVRYWTGPDAFGPYLERLRTEAGGDD
jgi:Na+-transporting NADH:ubiquinone oxidoreductase subunit C